MKQLFSVAFAAIILLFAQFVWAAPTAEEIMQKNFFASKPKRLKQEVTMTLVNERGQTRQRRMSVLSALQVNGTDSNILVRFLEPADVRGTGFLQIEHSAAEDDQWIYLPALRKSRRLVSNNRKDSFMGSDFAYGDVSLPKASLYAHKLLREEAVDGVACYVVESVPASEEVRRDYGYSRKTTWVAKDSFHEVRTEYHDTSGRLLKTQTLRDIVPIDTQSDRWLAKHKEMVNHQTHHKTVVTVDNYSVNPRIASDTYTLRTLERD